MTRYGAASNGKLLGLRCFEISICFSAQPLGRTQKVGWWCSFTALGLRVFKSFAWSWGGTGRPPRFFKR